MPTPPLALITSLGCLCHLIFSCRSQANFSKILVLGVFDDGRYCDIFTEYSKDTPNDVLIKITIANRGPETARVHVLPTLWFRNTWSWGCEHEACKCKPGSKLEGCTRKPKLMQTGPRVVECQHDSVGKYIFTMDSDQEGVAPEMIFTENESNFKVKWCWRTSYCQTALPFQFTYPTEEAQFFCAFKRAKANAERESRATGWTLKRCFWFRVLVRLQSSFLSLA